MQVYYIVPANIFESNFPEEFQQMIDKGVVAQIYQKDDMVTPKNIAKKINLGK